MDPRSMLLGFVIWVLYPAWLLAGAGDYFAHRQTDIARTSRSTESWLHLAQLTCIAAAFVAAVLFEITLAVWIWMLAAVVLHSLLAFIDVSYTDGRRFISPFEQHVHGYLDVIPLVAVALLGIANWPQIAAGGLELTARDPSTQGQSLLLWSFGVLAVVPTIEELIRTLTVASRPSGRTPRPATGMR
jgi:hypothetical protein